MSFNHEIVQKNAEIDFHPEPRYDMPSSQTFSLKDREANLSTMEFNNPLLPSGQDPFITFHHGEYNYVHTGASLGWTPVYVTTAPSLTGLREAERVPVWIPPKEGIASCDIWAPEIHFLQDKWWMYVAAWSGVHGDPHRMYVLEGGKHSQDPFEIKSEISPTETCWGIDGTVFQDEEKLFYVWSGKDEITIDGRRDKYGYTLPDNQNLYISEMENPWTLKGTAAKISVPTHPWEHSIPQPVNEGPQILQKNGKTFVVYSAGNTLADDYCLGMLVNETDDFLNAESWHKYVQPVFSKTDEVFAPGHASFTTTIDGKEDWIIYHSALQSGSGLNRHVNAQPFTWSSDGLPLLGRPISPQEKLLDTTRIPNEQIDLSTLEAVT